MLRSSGSILCREYGSGPAIPGVRERPEVTRNALREF
jgi:hypothetical protein